MSKGIGPGHYCKLKLAKRGWKTLLQFINVTTTTLYSLYYKGSYIIIAKALLVLLYLNLNTDIGFPKVGCMFK